EAYLRLLYGSMLPDALRKVCYHFHSLDLPYYMYLTVMDTGVLDMVPVVQGMLGHMGADLIAHCPANIFYTIHNIVNDPVAYHMTEIAVDSYCLREYPYSAHSGIFEASRVNPTADLVLETLDRYPFLLEEACLNYGIPEPTRHQLVEALLSYGAEVDMETVAADVDFIYRQTLMDYVRNDTCSVDTWDVTDQRVGYQLDSSIDIMDIAIHQMQTLPTLKELESSLDTFVDTWQDSVDGDICNYP
ncbi:hypothetical protein KIPB_001288, partial [Kipferlia bialata]